MRKEILEKKIKIILILGLIISTMYFYYLYSSKTIEIKALRSEYDSLLAEKEHWEHQFQLLKSEYDNLLNEKQKLEEKYKILEGNYSKLETKYLMLNTSYLLLKENFSESLDKEVLLRLYEQYLVAMKDIEATSVIATHIYVLQEMGANEEILKSSRNLAITFAKESIRLLEDIEKQLDSRSWSLKYSIIAGEISIFVTEANAESHVALTLLEKDKLSTTDIEQLKYILKVFEENRKKIYDLINQ